jgi:hypothetical protein
MHVGADMTLHGIEIERPIVRLPTARAGDPARTLPTNAGGNLISTTTRAPNNML